MVNSDARRPVAAAIDQQCGAIYGGERAPQPSSRRSTPRLAVAGRTEDRRTRCDLNHPADEEPTTTPVATELRQSHRVHVRRINDRSIVVLYAAVVSTVRR